MEPVNASEIRRRPTTLQELGTQLMDILRSEINSMKSEVSTTIKNVKVYSLELIIFGFITALCVFPLLAFLVIGLGRLLSDNYWLSSLIVAFVLAAGGGFATLRAWRKIPKLSFERDHQYGKGIDSTL